MENNLKKYLNGYDGLIRSISTTLSKAEIIVSVMDNENNNNWINVHFFLEGIVELKIVQKINRSNIVMSNGIKIKNINDLVYIDFSPYSDEIEDLHDFRQSDIYFGAKSVIWEELPYSEN